MSLKCNNCLQDDHVEDDCPHSVTEEYELWKARQLKKVYIPTRKVYGVNLGGVYRLRGSTDFKVLVTVMCFHHDKTHTEVRLLCNDIGIQFTMDIDKFRDDYIEVDLYTRDKAACRT